MTTTTRRLGGSSRTRSGGSSPGLEYVGILGNGLVVRLEPQQSESIQGILVCFEFCNRATETRTLARDRESSRRTTRVAALFQNILERVLPNLGDCGEPRDTREFQEGNANVDTAVQDAVARALLGAQRFPEQPIFFLHPSSVSRAGGGDTQLSIILEEETNSESFLFRRERLQKERSFWLFLPDTLCQDCVCLVASAACRLRRSALRQHACTRSARNLSSSKASRHCFSQRARFSDTTRDSKYQKRERRCGRLELLERRRLKRRLYSVSFRERARVARWRRTPAGRCGRRVPREYSAL